MELLRNSLLSLMMHAAPRAANALMFILIGRSLGATDAGIFQLAITYLLLFSVLTRGLDELVIRQLALSPGEARRYFATFLQLRLLLAFLLYGVLVFIVTQVVDYSASTTKPILLVSFGLIFDSMTSASNAVLLAQRRFGFPTMVAFGLGALRLVLGGALLAFKSPLDDIAALWALSSVAAAVVTISVVFVQTKEQSGGIAFDRSLASRELPSIVPFLVIGFLMGVEFQIDVILLSVLRDEQEVGYYGAATTIVFTLALIPQAYRTSVYPLMAHYARENHQQLILLYKRSLRYLGTLGIPMVAGIVLLAPAIIRQVFRSDFEPAAPALAMLAFVLIPTFLNVPNVRMMFVHNRQAWVTWLLVGSMLANVAVNLLLAPRMGAQGAALARTCSSTVFFLSNFLVLRFLVAKFDVQLLRILWRPFLATLLMSLPVWLMRGTPLPITVTLGSAVYLCALFLIGGIPERDRSLIHGVFQRL